MAGPEYHWQHRGGTELRNKIAMDIQQRTTEHGIGGMTPAQKLKLTA